MIRHLPSALVAAALAGLATYWCAPLAGRIARLAAAGGKGRAHWRPAQPVPRLGGLAIAAGLGLAACGVAIAESHGGALAGDRGELLGLAAGTLLMFGLGLVDDLVGLSAGKKLAVQLLAACLLLQLGWSFEVVSLPGAGLVHLGTFGHLVSALWIVGVMNAINLIDGLDGLAGGVVAIIALGLLAWALLQGDALTVSMLAAMAGACVGFLPHNWAPARIFMGDSGSLTLGFLLAAASVRSSLKSPTATAILVPVLALGLPVIDTLVVMGARFLGRPRRRLAVRFLCMFRGDHRHIHDRLEIFLAGRQRTVATIYGAVFAFCMMALGVALAHNAGLGLAFVATQFVAVLALRNLGAVRRLATARRGPGRMRRRAAPAASLPRTR